MTRSTTEATNVETALADPAFAALALGPIVVAGGSPPRILYASAQALALFQVKDASALSERLLKGSEPGARRLAELAASLPAGPPRLERLRFYVGGASEAITFQCKRLAGASPLFIAAAIGVRPALLATAQTLPEPVRAVEEQASASPLEPEAPARPTSVRFLWRTDSDLRFTRFDESGREALGAEPGAILGASILDLAGMPGFDPDGRLCAAIMRRETWSGVEVNWPLGDSGDYAPVLMGALPTFDTSRAFTGFSGFGVVHLDRIAQRPAPINEDLAADMAEESGAPDDIEQASAEEMAQIAQLINTPDDVEADATGEDAPEDFAADEPAAPETPAPAIPDSPYRAPNVVALNAWKNGAPPQPVAPAQQGPSTGPAETTRRSSEAKGAAPRDEFPSQDGEDEDLVRLTPAERNAFREIARALGARIDDADKRRAERDERKSAQDKSAQEKIAQDSRDEPRADGAPAMAAPKADDAKAAPANDAPREDSPSPRLSAPAAQASESSSMGRLLDRIDAGLMVCREGEAVYLNKSLLETLRYDSFDAFTAAGGISRMFRGRTPEAAAANGAVPVVRGDGETIALEGRLTAIEWDGAPAMLTMFRRPVETELASRVRALELDLRAREAEGRELHAILDTATDGVAILDGDGRILGLNRSAEALFGYEQNEVAGEPFTILFATESHPAALDYLT
ncbi:MAG: PAS domain-containing protein, partial [Beijerinckiaceae bacterium]|nr:PAS domain-containing protein [Beijerinckiaceae bacterium]